MPTLPPLSQIQSFVAVADYGRLNRAAEALHVTESTVSHHLRRLEATLGTRLLDRGRGESRLTPAAEHFYPKAREALQLLRDGVEDMVGGTDGKVVLTLPRALATHWLLPRYPRLYRDRADLDLQLLPTTRACDLERERIDLGIRSGAGQWPGVEARPLLTERICPLAVPSLAREWQQRGWDAMAGRYRLIGNSTHPAEWTDWCRRTGHRLPAEPRFTALESFDLVLQAGLAGSGLIMGRTPMVSDALARGELVAPFPQWLTSGNRYFIVWPVRCPPNRHASVVVDWLVDCAAEADQGLGQSDGRDSSAR